MTDAHPDIESIVRNFAFHGQFLGGARYGSGHINDTFAVRFDAGETPVRYILQRVNHGVFPDPPALMQNIERVTRHQRACLRGSTDRSRRALRLIPTEDGASWYRDPCGCYWRAYVFIENATAYNVLQDVEQAFQAARAFGAFQRSLVDLPGGRLHETIPRFHDTPSRFRDFLDVLENDPANRAREARSEIRFALAREASARTFLDLHREGAIPERVTHNDTKLNNVLIDDATGEGLCVIDLDTVMPGLALYDFGDMVRSAVSPAQEDEQDLSKVCVRMAVFEALVGGYLAALGAVMLPTETANLAFSGTLMAYECGLRFLADFLAGDVYFKISREGQNLDRCRTQFRLVECIADQEDAMSLFVERVCSEGPDMRGPVLSVSTPRR